MTNEKPDNVAVAASISLVVESVPNIGDDDAIAFLRQILFVTNHKEFWRFRFVDNAENLKRISTFHTLLFKELIARQKTGRLGTAALSFGQCLALCFGIPWREIEAAATLAGFEFTPYNVEI